MTQLRTKSRIVLFAIIFFLFGIVGCAGNKPTQPNSPYPGAYPSSVETLRKTNPLLVSELGKLPEIIDGISNIESDTMGKIASVHTSNPKVFDKAFHIMYQVGKPKVRKYCTLLQALFWYALDHNTRQISAYLGHYDGESIDPEYPFLETITVHLLLSDTWDFKDRNRWKNPKMVIERLNAPELFEYWFSRVFVYDFSKVPRPLPVSGQSAEESIRTQEGVCTDAANLARVCLLKAGYKATGLNVVYSPGTWSRRHSVCVIEIETQQGPRFITVGDTKKPGSIGLPYTSIKAIAQKISRGYGSHLDWYTVGFPGFDSL
jgi:hypothetical protein